MNGPEVKVRFAEQRQQFVLRALATEGRVEAARLAEELGVSTESIRKDLGLLEDRGLLRRVHGGAIPVQELTFEPAVNQRTEQLAEKEAIARAALAHLPAGGSVLLDAGSTTERLAALLPEGKELSVVTNALPIATLLAARGDLSVRLLGGPIRPKTLATVGQDAIDQLAAVNVDVAFLGTNSLSFDRGLTTPDESEAAVKAAMTRAARTRVLLADHTKFGKVSLARHATLADLDRVITDPGTSEPDRAALAAAGIEVEVAVPR